MDLPHHLPLERCLPLCCEPLPSFEGCGADVWLEMRKVETEGRPRQGRPMRYVVEWVARCDPFQIILFHYIGSLTYPSHHSTAVLTLTVSLQSSYLCSQLLNSATNCQSPRTWMQLPIQNTRSVQKPMPPHNVSKNALCSLSSCSHNAHSKHCTCYLPPTVCCAFYPW
jgi:hypothetical protein